MRPPRAGRAVGALCGYPRGRLVCPVLLPNVHRKRVMRLRTLPALPLPRSPLAGCLLCAGANCVIHIVCTNIDRAAQWCVKSGEEQSMSQGFHGRLCIYRARSWIMVASVNNMNEFCLPLSRLLQGYISIIGWKMFILTCSPFHMLHWD